MSRKLLVVTFDIRGATGGDRRYKRVDDYLTNVAAKTAAGQLLFSRAFKQTRLVVTKLAPTKIQLQICGLLGANGNVFVACVKRPYRFRHGDLAQRLLVLREFMAYA